MAYDLFCTGSWDLLSYICKTTTTTTTAKQSQAFLRESRRFWSKPHAAVHLLWFSPTALYMALVLPVVRGKPPEVFSQLELPAWGTKVEMGPAESTASTFAQVQSNAGFTKPFPFEIYYDPPQGDRRRNKVIRRGNGSERWAWEGWRRRERPCASVRKHLLVSSWLPLFPVIAAFFSREYAVQN